MPTSPRGLPARSTPRRSAAAELVQGSGQSDTKSVPAVNDAKGSDRRSTRRLSLDLDARVVEDLKDAVVYLQRNGEPEVTQVSIVSTAIAEAVGSLQRDRDVDQFPPRGEHRPKPGRRPT